MNDPIVLQSKGTGNGQIDTRINFIQSDTTVYGYTARPFGTVITQEVVDVVAHGLGAVMRARIPTHELHLIGMHAKGFGDDARLSMYATRTTRHQHMGEGIRSPRKTAPPGVFARYSTDCGHCPKFAWNWTSGAVPWAEPWSCAATVPDNKTKSKKGYVRIMVEDNNLHH
jgi:hypothetical protein